MSGDTVAARGWELWSTSCRLVVTDPARLDDAAGLVDGELARIEQACSRFRPDSELMSLATEDGVVELSPLLAELVGAALAAARETGGAVDPTLGSVLSGLGYDRDITEVRLEAGPTRVVVMRHAGWRSLSLEGRRLRLPSQTALDLGATAKAVAADRCARLVHDELGVGLLVSLGGDISTAGPPPRGGWQVTVQDLPTDVPQQIALRAGAAVATSSSARRTWSQAGRHRHHLVDPLTRLPAAGPWRSITVLAPTCLQANTASTAAMVKGEDALGWLRSTGLPARLVPHEGGLVTLGGWPREAAA